MIRHDAISAAARATPFAVYMDGPPLQYVGALVPQRSSPLQDQRSHLHFTICFHLCIMTGKQYSHPYKSLQATFHAFQETIKNFPAQASCRLCS